MRESVVVELVDMPAVLNKELNCHEIGQSGRDICEIVNRRKWDRDALN